ncbi:hypothetical protein [Oceanisphaera avium]|uniref:Uncharacterized protein n=1 Tax=Oceanisphaera avium TaxID=1903694 RepID=A0A1Y0CVW2_9GAMM|nr:hypothetical protein [Oceanisphaera avium]ART79473.1 hypothetical protein CBP12_04335 [Oceanisphaera avium]
MPQDASTQPTHTDELLRSSSKLRGRIADLSLQLSRDLGPIPTHMKPRDVWLNQLVSAQETLPRGKFFNQFRCKDKLEQYCLAVTYLRDLANQTS